MPLRLDVKRKLTARSDRVKSVDLHPTEPWMLASLYNGNVHVWNIDSQQLVKSFEVCDLPVRASRFVARKNWVVTGSDDMQVRVYNYNTLERVHQFEAHSDYVRCIAVHPTQPFILTCSDDMTIKLWNWDKKWSCQQVFEGHSHYVMQIVINPKDNNTFASASLDRTVKVWQLGSPQPNFTLEGHQRGVNCVDYYHGGDKPYLISGADDSLVKIWDYQNKTCVQTLEGHSQNVSSVSFHPELPIILTGSEDCTVRVWHANTYRLENTLNYGLDRVWCISALKGSNNVCFGYDEGSVMVKVGREEPAMSMDVSGKIVWAKHSEIQQANLKAMGEAEHQDGERLPLAVKDLGACDIYPQTIAHNPNGRFVVVCGDGEYIIYTAMALRNKAFGPALEFVWALDSSEYAIRESNFSVKLFKNFKEKKAFKPDFGCEGIYGGYLLGCRSSTTGLAFYDWETQELVRRIEIQPRQVFWSENGDYVCIATDSNYFILKYSAEAVANAREKKEGVTEDGIEDAFDLVGEVQEVVKTGKWVGDCFIYTNSVNRLNYYVGGEIVTIAHLDRTLYLLGYIPKENRLYLGDKELNVVSYELLVSVLEYQTAVMRRDFTTADRVLPTIPPAHRTRVAHFLEKQGFKKQALAVSTDPEHKFDLALSLGELEVCHQLAAEAGSEHKWRLVADLAQQRGDLQMAQTCLLRAHDYPGLLLQATATGNASFIREVGKEAEGQGRNNVAFLSHFLTGSLKECLELLIKTNRIPEAAFFARTYLPSEISRVVGLWKEAAGEKIAQTLADPAQYDNLFPGIKDALKTQQYLEKETRPVPAASTSSVLGNHERDAQEEMRAAEAAGTFVYMPSEGEDQEFVDAPQQPEAQGASGVLKEESLLSMTMSEPVSATSVPSSAALPADLLMPTPAIPLVSDTVCDEPLKKGDEDHEGGHEIGIREDDDEDLLGRKTSHAFATKKVENAPLESMGEEGVFGQERNYPEISSAATAGENPDYAKGESFILKDVSKMSCAAQPEFALLTEDEEGIMSTVSKAIKEGLLTNEGKDCTNMELKEDEEFLLPLKKDGDVLLPVKEDEENLLLVKEYSENVQAIENDKEIIVPGGRDKVVQMEKIQKILLAARKMNTSLSPLLVVVVVVVGTLTDAAPRSGYGDDSVTRSWPWLPGYLPSRYSSPSLYPSSADGYLGSYDDYPEASLRKSMIEDFNRRVMEAQRRCHDDFMILRRLLEEQNHPLRGPALDTPWYFPVFRFPYMPERGLETEEEEEKEEKDRKKKKPTKTEEEEEKGTEEEYSDEYPGDYEGNGEDSGASSELDNIASLFEDSPTPGPEWQIIPLLPEVPDADDLPDKYDNSTHTIHILNGSRVEVNTTTHKDSGDVVTTFYHTEVINILPDESEEDTTEEPLPEETTDEGATETPEESTKDETHNEDPDLAVPAELKDLFKEVIPE